jgi:DNA-binding PadR family transcriptional regulator
MKQKGLGDFEELLLLAVARLKDEAYGVPIMQMVEKEAKRRASIGAIYTTLDRLEAKGFVRSWLGEATAERGGRAKKYFAITGTGVVALQNAEAARERMRRGVDLGALVIGGAA